MIRVNVLAEGQTEMAFAKKTLNSYFEGRIILDSRCVLTGKDNRTNREYRGGMTTYERARKDILCWLKEDKSAYVTTMFDFYGLPKNFPQYKAAMQCPNHMRSVLMLEAAMKNDVLHSLPDILPQRFIPYIQLHEFETLLFTDIRILEEKYIESEGVRAIESLYEETKEIPPEEINNGSETAPSKRLLRTVDYHKGELPAIWLESLTVPKVRERCPHFSQWIEVLDGLIELPSGA